MTFHEKILSKLLEYQIQNPNFKFVPRQNVNERMKTGYWFQGTQNYAFVGLLNKSGGANRTKSLGLVFWPKTENSFGCYIELVYKGETNKQLLSLYESIKTTFGGFVDKGGQKFQKYLPDTNESFASVYQFLDTFYPQLNNLAIKSGIANLFLSDSKFEKAMATINLYRTKSIQPHVISINKLLVNISWNSKDWKEESKDKSNHQWVRDGGIPGESWNFAYDAEGNTEDRIYGYAKFTHQPKIEGSSIFIFYSDGKIVGFYGDASLNNTQRNGHEMNLCGSKPLSFVLQNKIENILEKGYLEDGKRIGQIGFNYLSENNTILSILDEALQLNPNQNNEINKLKEWFIKVTNTTVINSKNDTMNNEANLNQILFGPPGTGKTYNSINKAISIINPDFEISSDRNLVKKGYERLVNEGNVSFCTFHQSMSYEDFIEGIKPIKPEEEDKFIKYQVESGIFKMACANAAYLCYKKYKSKNQKNSEYNFDELHDAFINHIQELMDNNTPPVYKTLKGKDVTVIKITSTNSIKARALNSKATRNPAPLTKENLEKLYDKFSTIDEIKSLKQVEETVEVTPRITEFYAVFKALKEFEKNDFKPDVEYQEEMNDIETIDINEKLVKFEAGVYTNAIKQYGKVSEPVVLIIDEINRGNVSQIFGELITLIEEDKRMGNEESLEVLLPYSKKKFGVPPNLYIIGTMNTADRSVEALDTALRRRFSFEEMLPNSKVVEEKGFNDYLRKEVMEKINNRIELLLDRNHTLGHAYFIKENFENSFENEIIPLLQEYFYNDYGKIGLVLGKGFVREKSISATRDKTIFADFETKNEVDIVKSYELIPFEQVDFKTAITTLLG